MSESMKKIDRVFWVMAMLSLVVHVLPIGLVSGCSTVRPVTPKDSQPSWDGNEQNSGFIGFAPGGAGLITDNARARYNAMIGVYGSRYSPPLKPDAGVSPAWKMEDGRQVWFIDAQHLVIFMEMNRWRKEGVGKRE